MASESRVELGVSVYQSTCSACSMLQMVFTYLHNTDDVNQSPDFVPFCTVVSMIIDY